MSSRTKLYATIFWQCKELRLDEDGRRDVLEAVTGKRSLKEIPTTKQLVKVVEDLAERGAVPSSSTGRGRPRRSSRRPVNGAPGSVARMITTAQRQAIIDWMQWKNLSAAYVRGLSRRICGHDFPQTTKQASALIATLSSDRVPNQNQQKEQTL